MLIQSSEKQTEEENQSVYVYSYILKYIFSSLINFTGILFNNLTKKKRKNNE